MKPRVSLVIPLYNEGNLHDLSELITEFYAKYKEGYDVVYAVRKKTKGKIQK